MAIIHAYPLWMRVALEAVKPDQPKKKQLGQGRWRANAKLTSEQVIEILDRRENHGQLEKDIAREMGLSFYQVCGVTRCGNGTRTVLINHQRGKPDKAAP
ncbi:MAG TPA: hypothetical protein VF151_10995 [Gemmatimonadales bacterium]